MANSLPQKSQGAAPFQAQKSHGAYPRGQNPHPYGTDETSFIDHTNSTGISISCGYSPQPGAPILPPLWSYQVYVTYGPTASSAPDLPSKFFDGLWGMRELTPLRFDFNFLPSADMEACKAHYQCEKAAREQSNTPLKFVSKYYKFSYENMLILMDSPNWADTGVSFISFDLPPECRDPASDVYTPVETLIERDFKVFKTEPEPAGAMTYVSGRIDTREVDNMALFIECEKRYNEAIEAGKSLWL